MGLIGNPETSALNHLKSRNNPENGRILFDRVGSMRFRTESDNFVILDFRLSPWNEYWFLVLGFLHGVSGKFSVDVSGAAVGPETSPGNSPRTPCKTPKAKNQLYVI
jgi:hypothetical protein